MSEHNIPVTLTGDSTSLMSAFEKATEGIRHFAHEGGASIGGLHNPLHSLTETMDSFKGVSMGAMGAVAAVAVAIGAMFHVGEKAVESTVEFGKEMIHLHHFMGGTVQAAGELSMALYRIGVPVETFIAAMTKEMKSVDKVIANHKELKSELLNSNGTYKSMGEMTGVLTEKYLSFADAGDRARFAIEVWGKSGPEAVAMLEKVKKAQDDNRKVLGDLAVDYHEIETKTKAYLKAQRDLKVIHEAQSLQIGSVLLPIWTDFQVSLGKTASDIMPSIIGAFQVFASALLIAIGTLKTNFLVLKTIIEGLINVIVPLIQAAYEAIQGNYSEAWKTLKAGGLDAYEQLKKGMEGVKKSATDTVDAVARVWDPHKSNVEVADETVSTTKPKDKDKESALERVKAKLEAAKALYEMQGLYELDAHNNIIRKKAEADQVNRVYTKEMESKFLADELAKFDGTEKDKQKLTTMRFAADREVMKQGWASKLVQFENEIKAQTQSNQEAIRLAKEKAEKILTYEGGNKNSADYQKALGEVAALEKKAADHVRDISIAKDEIILASLLAEKEAEIKAINHQVEMGNISELNGLKQIQAIEDKKFAIAKASLEKRLALRKLEGDAGQKEAVKIEGELAKLNDTAAAKKIDTEHKTNLIIRNGWNTLFSGVKQEMNKSIQGLILGTTTLSGALKNIWASMKAAFAQMAADQLMIWLGLEKSKQAASGESAVVIFATETAASIKKVALWIWEGLKYVAIQAWRAAAGAYQAIVGIPYVGPFLAPIAAAVALAAVMKMVSSIASAKGGYDIKAGENPVTQLHEKEMVLPAEHADTIRSLKGSDSTKAILESNMAIFRAMARSQASVDKYNSASKSPKAPTGGGGGGHNITVHGFVGSERQLAQTINSVLNRDARLYGSGR